MKRKKPGSRHIPLGLLFSVLLGCWAVGVHLTMIRSVTDPIFYPDSESYLIPAFNLLAGQAFNLPADRTPAYPLLLYAVLKTSRHFMGLLIFQHGLACLTGLLAAFVYHRWFRPSLLGAALVFFLAAALPQAVLYAHAAMTETIYTFWVVAAVLVFLAADPGDRWSLWVLLGVLLAMAILTRPVGRSLAGALLAAYVIQNARHRRWRGLLYGGLTVAGILLGYSTWNVHSRGFWGIDQMGGTALFCTTAPYLDPDQIKDPVVRDTLKPLYANARDKMSNGAWVYSAPDGPMQKLARVVPASRMDRLARHLAFLAIRQRPLSYLLDRLSLFVEFLRTYSEISFYALNREFTFFVYSGLRRFEKVADIHPVAWSFLGHGPELARTYMTRMLPLALGRVPDPEAFISQMDRIDAFRYENVLLWWRPIMEFLRHMRWLPCFALIAAWVMWRTKSLRRPTTVCVLVIIFHIGLSTMAAFQDVRFAVPITPLYILFFVGGLQEVSSRLRPLFRKRREQ